MPQRSVYYDPLISEIEIIGQRLSQIKDRIQAHLQNEALPYRLPEFEDNVSAVVEAAVAKMAYEISQSPLPIRKWQHYVELYQQIIDIARTRKDIERRIWLNEITLANIEIIAKAMRGKTVLDPYWGDSPRLRMIIAIAIYYTVDRLAATP